MCMLTENRKSSRQPRVMIDTTTRHHPPQDTLQILHREDLLQAELDQDGQDVWGDHDQVGRFCFTFCMCCFTSWMPVVIATPCILIDPGSSCTALLNTYRSPSLNQTALVTHTLCTQHPAPSSPAQVQDGMLYTPRMITGHR